MRFSQNRLFLTYQETPQTRAKSNIVTHFVVRNDEKVVRRINATPDSISLSLSLFSSFSLVNSLLHFSRLSVYAQLTLALNTRVHGPHPIHVFHAMFASCSDHFVKVYLCKPGRHLERRGPEPELEMEVCLTHVTECRWSTVCCVIGCCVELNLHQEMKCVSVCCARCGVVCLFDATCLATDVANEGGHRPKERSWPR